MNIRKPDVCSRNENHDEKEKHHRKDDHQCRRSVRPRTILTLKARCERRRDTALESSAPRDRGPLSPGEGWNDSWSYGLRSVARGQSISPSRRPTPADPAAMPWKPIGFAIAPSRRAIPPPPGSLARPAET